MFTSIEKIKNVELTDEEIRTLENAGTLITQIANNLNCNFKKVTNLKRQKCEKKKIQDLEKNGLSQL